MRAGVVMNTTDAARGGTAVNPTIIATLLQAKTKFFFTAQTDAAGRCPKMIVLTPSPTSGVRGPLSARLFLGRTLIRAGPVAKLTKLSFSIPNEPQGVTQTKIQALLQPSNLHEGARSCGFVIGRLLDKRFGQNQFTYRNA